MDFYYHHNYLLLMLHPLWLADAFGGAAYARIFSLSNAVSVLGVAAGPTLLGLVFDGFGYPSAYVVGAWPVPRQGGAAPSPGGSAER